MLKTLRVTSLIAVALAVCGVAAVVIFGLKGDSEIRAFLDKPSLIEELKKRIGEQKGKEDVVSPLAAQAKLIALRIDPPPPPVPPKPKEEPKVARTQTEAAQTARPIPTPFVQVSMKFDLLATVYYESAPEKSLALLSSGLKQEWFRQGDKVGQQEINEVRNGSVIFIQGGGKNPQEVFVPAKPAGQSLLKGEQIASASGARRSSIQDIAAAAQEDVQEQPAGTGTEVTDTGTVRVVRTRDNAAAARGDVAARIQRVRSAPSEPTPAEQKAALENSIASIREAMTRQDENLTEEERLEEKQMWAEVLKALQSEKQLMEAAVAPEESASTPGVSPAQEASAAETGVVEPQSVPVQTESPADPNSTG